MVRNIVSFLLAGSVVLSVYFINASMRSRDAGQAVAAPAASLAAKGVADNFKDARFDRELFDLRRNIVAQPERFLNITGRDVEKLFQRPELVRSDAPTVVWQYRNEFCVLDLFFASMDDQVHDAQVLHFEVSARAHAEEGAASQTFKAQCLQAMVNKNYNLASRIDDLYNSL